MKKARMRVTQWLGDIPVEAECAACAGVRFRASGTGHRPDRIQYAESLQRQFDRHVRTSHEERGRSTPDSSPG